MHGDREENQEFGFFVQGAHSFKSLTDFGIEQGGIYGDLITNCLAEVWSFLEITTWHPVLAHVCTHWSRVACTTLPRSSRLYQQALKNERNRFDEIQLCLRDAEVG